MATRAAIDDPLAHKDQVLVVIGVAALAVGAGAGAFDRRDVAT